jgi:hypothetical protein
MPRLSKSYIMINDTIVLVFRPQVRQEKIAWYIRDLSFSHGPIMDDFPGVVAMTPDTQLNTARGYQS